MGQWYLHFFRRREEKIPIDGYLMVGEEQIRLKKLILQLCLKLNVSPSELKSLIKQMKDLIKISENNNMQ
ncbi:unnamed protein product [Bursaphelenchus xylophilus]|nr:unnamed protein product [Bursaphelenchus xylophilus]CAG9096290.1 unnamed protein product [Bursaphelenchus xylophilus]